MDHIKGGLVMATQVKIKRFVFNNGTPDFIFSFEEYYEIGYREIIKENCLCISDIKEVKDDKMGIREFNNLPAWEG